MISEKLIHQVHECADRLTNDLIQAVQADPRCEAYKGIPRSRLIELKDELYRNLGRWLTSHSRSAIEVRYVKLGRERYLEGIPLSEFIYALHLTKSMLLSFIRRCLPGQAEDVSLEYELALAISEFFDEAIYCATIGYEDAAYAGLSAPPKVEVAAVPRAAKRAPEQAYTGAEEDLAVSRGGQIGEASG
jgi:hypothetical protein